MRRAEVLIMRIGDMLKRGMVMNMLDPFFLAQFGPPRSGSTLIYNLTREIFPMKKVIKTHTFRKICGVLRVVATYRHPFDSIASMIVRHGIENPSNADVETEISQFNENGIWDVVRINNMPNVLMLRYESFVDDFDYVFDNFEEFFKICISSDTRGELKQKYGIDNVKKMIENMDSFKDHDRKSQLHGRHISKYNGTSYHKDFFSESQLNRLNSEYSEVLTALGY